MAAVFERFLSKADTRRVGTCLATLRRHGAAEWALTGGVAIELRLMELSGQVETRISERSGFRDGIVRHRSEHPGNRISCSTRPPFRPA